MDCTCFRSCWQYLRNKPKFVSYLENIILSKKFRQTKKRSVEAVSTSSPSTSNDLNDTVETVDVDGDAGGEEVTVEDKRPPGRDSAKNRIKKGDSLYKMMASLQEDKKSSEAFFAKHLEDITAPMNDIGMYAKLLAEEKKLEIE
jgi:hypothetical protein